MSTAHPDESPVEDEVLQFDEAEFSAPAPAVQLPICVNCQQPIPDAYFEINGKVVCGHCREGVLAAVHGGSGMARFMRASLFGLGAAVVGAVLYYIVARTTGYNIGLIAILVGFMVGRAVHVGTGNRGGRVYQFLALFLTYSAIVAMNAPLVIEEVLQEKAHEQAAPGPAQLPNGAGIEAQTAPPKAAPDVNRVAAPRGPLPLVVFLGFAIAFFYAIPVIEVMSAPISAVIYGFGLWEAWRINKGVKLVINGPFRVGEGAHAG